MRDERSMMSFKDHIRGLTPDAIMLGQQVFRRAAKWKAAGLIFVHVPKNGGTSINKALYGQLMGHYRVRDIERFRPSLLREIPSLGLIRNPWARAYSAWNFARRGTQMTDGAQIHDPGRYKGAEFATFEHFVLGWLPGRDLEHEDFVFRPQSHFLLDRGEEIGVSHLGRIERPDTYLPFIEETIGRRVEVGHVNRTASAGAYRDAYTPEMRDLVAQAYRRDVEVFGCDF